MANLSKTTRDHDEIRRWAEERGGKPAHVKNTGSAEDIGILRIDFPGYSGEGSLEPISWEGFFEKFDERGLALVYQEETAGGQKSNFNKLVSADTAAASQAGRQGRSRASRSRSLGSPASASGTARAAKKSGASKKASTSTRSSASAKKTTKATSRTALRKAARNRAGAKKSSKTAAGKKSFATKRSARSRKAVKKSAPKRRR